MNITISNPGITLGRRLTLFCFALLMGSLSMPTLATDYKANAPISAVVVSQRGAVVTRVGVVDVAAGEHQLVVPGLPATLDLGRLNLSIDGTGARLGSLRVQRTYQDTLTGEAQQDLQDELEALRYERGLIEDSVAAASAQLKLLDALSTGQMQSSIASAQELAALVTLVESSALSAKQRIRDAERQKQKLSQRIQQKKQELDQYFSRDRLTQSALASIDVPEATTLNFTITYPVGGAHWNWLYEAHLDTSRSFLEIGRQVAITQTTGEPWNNIALTISSATTSSRIAPPPHLGQTVSLQPPPTIAFAKASAEMAASPKISRSVGAAIAAGDEYLQSSANITGTAFQVDYRVPGKVSVATGSEQQIFQIDERGIDVQLMTISRPLQDSSVYLEARFTLKEDFPIQPGAMQFYRDGTYIGSRGIKGFLPKEETQIPFGVDPRIRIQIEADEEESDAGSTFRRTAVENTRTRILITSFHSEPREIDVFASVPIAQSADIEVEPNDDATRPTERDVDGNSGELRWRLTLQPAQQQTINHFYSIEYPRDETLFYQHSR